MLAAVSFALAGAVAQEIHPAALGYDVVEYFSLQAGTKGVLGSEEFQANLTSSDLTTNNTVKMEVREAGFCQTKQQVSQAKLAVLRCICFHVFAAIACVAIDIITTHSINCSPHLSIVVVRIETDNKLHILLQKRRKQTDFLGRSVEVCACLGWFLRLGRRQRRRLGTRLTRSTG